MSPLVRGWKALVALAAVTAQQAGTASGPGAWGGMPGNLPEVWLAVTAVLVVVAAALALGRIAWRFTTYRIVGDTLRVDSGVLVRRTRQVRLDRVQSIEVVRPPVARVLGLAELRLSTAGGPSTVGSLAYLGEREAVALRAELLARSAGLAPGTPPAPERVLHVVSPRDLVVSRLLRLPVLAVLAGAVALPVLAAVAGTGPGSLAGGWGFVVLVLPAVLAFAAAEVTGLAGSYGFTVAQSPDGLRLRHGLMETHAETVPPGRVQAVAVVEPALWRRWRGWCRLEVNVAGRPGQGEPTLLLPVATRATAERVLASVLPGLDLARVPLAPAPRRAQWLDPLAARVLGVGADEHYLISRTGRWCRVTTIVPHERVQSVRVRQGPVARRLGLATLAFDSTPGPVRPLAPHRDATEARVIWETQVEAARRSRARAGPARWMTAPPRSDRTPGE